MRLPSLSITTLCLLLSLPVLSQSIDFVDPALKAFLIQQRCVDTTYDESFFSNDISVDRNGDGEIQLSEALRVKKLELKDYPNQYAIHSLNDLNAFSNLTYLKVLSIDELANLSQLSIDSLQSLWVADCENLRIINISNSPNITASLRIEGLTKLDSLNTQNGTEARVFSLFYTINIKNACIDDFETEYEAFDTFGAMLPGAVPSVYCGLSNTEEVEELESSVIIYPNPTNHFIQVQAELPIQELEMLSTLGESLLYSSRQNVLDLSSFPAGIYLLRIKAGPTSFIKKVYIE